MVIRRSGIRCWLRKIGGLGECEGRARVKSEQPASVFTASRLRLEREVPIRPFNLIAFHSDPMPPAGIFIGSKMRCARIGGSGGDFALSFRGTEASLRL